MTIEEKILQDVQWLSGYGADPQGGITRLLYSKPWKDAQEGIRKKMEDLGFQANYDEVGNLFVALEGTIEKESIILSGSHIDTVVNGGNLDGQYGILGGLLALQLLKERYGNPKRTIEIVSMAEEEGSRFPFTFWGSKNIVGEVKPQEVEGLADCNGISFPQAMREAGFYYKNKGKNKKKIYAFVELHIEQGAVLEREKFSIGVVESIVGQKRFEISILGRANHAGTTPMSYRQDSLHCSAKIICRIMEEAKKIGDPMVATVGKIEICPNTPNVIPGKTGFTLDIRHDSQQILDQFDRQIRQISQEATTSMGMKAQVSCYGHICPVSMNPDLVRRVENQCCKRNISYRKMTSGAGHDAQIFAFHSVPSAMIFVPSVGGISHNKEEYTHSADLAQGVQLLMDVFHDLAY